MGTDLFSGFGTAAQSVFEAIKNALAGGDIDAAAAVFWSTLELAWATGVDALSGVWTGFLRFVTDTWTELQRNIQKGIAWIMSFIDGSDFAEVSATIDEMSDARLADSEAAQSSSIAKAEADLAAAKAEFQSAIAVANATPATSGPTLAAAASLNTSQATIAGASASTASMGTFSNMAARVLAGPDSGIVSALGKTNELLTTIADNTTEEQG